ncbi:hypothetical protein [Euzebya sp.]|uniref:hypothetical protein n=1 Tax=Euzebya sp. TaxID=1971409 RepID=UPI00351684C3
MEGSPPVRQVAIARLPEQPAHDPELPLDHPPGPIDPSDPAAVAVALIASGLAEEGLEVMDLGVETLLASPDAVTVRVAAAHLAELASAPHTSVYELHLTREPGGTWRLVGYRQAH